MHGMMPMAINTYIFCQHRGPHCPALRVHGKGTEVHPQRLRIFTRAEQTQTVPLLPHKGGILQGGEQLPAGPLGRKRRNCTQIGVPEAVQTIPSPGGVAQLVERVLYHSTRRAVPERSWVQSLLPTTEVEPGFSTFGGMLVPVLQLISPVCKTGTSLLFFGSSPNKAEPRTQRAEQATTEQWQLEAVRHSERQQSMGAARACIQTKLHRTNEAAS
jgi:hypothetical protein